MSIGSGTYAQFAVQNGACYMFSTCDPNNPNAFDTQVTGYNPSGTVKFYNNNNGPDCSGTWASASWTADFSGTLRVMVNRNNCFGWDGTGNSATLKYWQIPPVITSSSSDMCPGQTRTLTATNGCNQTVNTGSWSGTGVGGSTFTAPSTPGTYTVTYTLGACAVSQQITVVAPSAAATSIVGNLSVCPGGSTTLSVTGGTLGSGGQWVWYAGGCGSGSSVGTGTSITVSPSSNTTYYVRAESTCGNTACVQASVTINTLSTAPTGVTVTNANICQGTSTTLTATGGTLGTGSNYYWYIGNCGNGPLVGSGPSITVNPLSTTTYFVRAEGPCNTTGCASQLVTVTPSPNISVTGIGTPSACGAADGFVTVVATGGTAPYTYVWSNGQTGPNLTNADAGGYCVTVTDNAGCTDVFCIALSDPNASVATLTASDQDLIVCQNECVTFTGSGGYIYNFWSSVNGLMQSGTTPTLQHCNLQNGETVWLESIDFNFCTYTTQVIGPFTVVPTPVITETITDPSSCGASDGSITTVVSGGTSFTYNWYGGANGPDTVGIPAGPYVLTVTNQNGCSTTETYALNDPGAQPTSIVTNDADSIICQGENITFVASGSNTYTWFVNGPQVATGATYSTTSLTASPSVVVATGLDGNGCTSTSNSIPITVLPGPNVNIISTDTALCLGDLVTFTGIGANTYEFFWNNTSQGPSSSTSSFVTNTLADGDEVYVIGTDLNGCPINSDTITVTVTPPPHVSLVNLQNPQSCGANDGFITVTGAGGTPPYANYVWSEGTVGSAIAGINSGIYIVTVTDNVGCTGDTAFALSDIGSTPTTMTDSDLNDTICYGEAVTFTASGGSTYAWYINGGTTPVSTVNPYTTTGLNDGDYIGVIGYDTALCASTSLPVQFTVLPDINTSIVSYTNPTACGANDGTANAIVVGGWPPYTYMWSPSGSTNTFATGLSAGVHTFTVTDLYGCSASDSETLSDVGAPTVSIMSDAFGNLACENDTVTFTASSPATLTYDFYYGGNLVSSGVNPYSQVVTQSGSVSVLGTDVNNCTGSAMLYMNVSPAPPAGWGGPLTDVCQSVDTVILVGGTPVGGTYEVFYPSPSPGFTLTGGLMFPSNLPAGPNTVTYVTTDPITGCKGKAQQTVNVNASPVVNLGPDTTACGLILDAGTGNYTYVWSPVNPSPGASTYDVPTTGVYYVTVTDNATGCEGDDAIGVTLLPVPLPDLNFAFGDTVGICPDSSVQLCVLNPGAYPGGISWDNGAGINPCFQINPIQATHNLSVTNQYGCTRIDSFYTDIYPSANPQISVISGVTEFCKGGSVTLSVGGPWASVHWSSHATTPDIVVTETGNYCVTVLDANGCIDSVLGPDCVPVTVWNPDPILYQQGENLIISNNPGTWSVQWYHQPIPDPATNLPMAGETGDTLVTVTGGWYSAVVSDVNGCETTTQIFFLNTGITDLSAAYDINVYPNPTEGIFTLEADFGKDTDARIELRNMLSQLVVPVEDVSSNVVKRVYNLNHLPAGMYIISIETAEGKAVKRITKR